ncbi:MAG: hypothetical protein CM15mP55_2850 [Hyphomicrobiales bacterium]|nr:MAG: hypothetical protein CM15mP55_2850 [Hyphomicrobiales bacterium]
MSMCLGKPRTKDNFLRAAGWTGITPGYGDNRVAEVSARPGMLYGDFRDWQKTGFSGRRRFFRLWERQKGGTSGEGGGRRAGLTVPGEGIYAQAFHPGSPGKKTTVDALVWHTCEKPWVLVFYDSLPASVRAPKSNMPRPGNGDPGPGTRGGDS